MRRLAEQSLNSSVYAQQEAEGLQCICCGVMYPGAGTHCHRCQAPLEVSRAVMERETAGRFLCVLGASGAGKTVYLGMLLDMLSRGKHELRGTPHGSYSVAMQENTIAALQRRRFPEKTASESDAWEWVHCEVTRREAPKRPWDVLTPDVAGEAVAMEVEHPRTYPAIASIAAQAAGVLIVCDAIATTAASSQEDVFALKLASYVRSAQAERAVKKRRRHPVLDVPVAIVLTKCDQCPDVRQNAEQFAQNHLPRLRQFCETEFSHVRYFATSVVSDCVTAVDEYGCSSDVALHVEPRGVLEPISWIMSMAK